MKYAVATVRLSVSALMLVAMTVSFIHDATHGVDVWPWDWFGYFTNQNNLAAGFMLTVAAAGLITNRRFCWLDYVRGAVTTYIVIVGAVFWTLLAPVTVVAIPWTNDVMHAIVPSYCLLDWLLVGDRAPLRFSKLWVIFPYAVVWLGVTLTRGATDHWVPYPFMNPDTGYASVSLYCGAIVVLAVIFALAFWGASRWRGVLLRGGPALQASVPTLPAQRIAS